MLGKITGIWPASEGGTTPAALLCLLKEKWIKEGDSMVLFNTGSGARYSRPWDY
jgi:hypothetical protein